MSCILVEEAVASICSHLVGELLHIVLVGESFDFLFGRIVSVENICRYTFGTGVHTILHQPPSQRSQSEEPED